MEYFKRLLRKTGWISLLESIFFAVIGIVLMINPEGTVKVISYILGTVFILIGVYKIADYFIRREKGQLYNYGLIYGIMAVIIGIITMCFSSSIGALFRIIIGIWIIYSALLRVNASINLKDMKVNAWKYSLGLAIIMLICGIIVIANSGAIVATIGTFILVYSIIDIIENIIFLRNSNIK